MKINYSYLSLMMALLLTVSCDGEKKKPHDAVQYKTLVVSQKDMTLSRQYSARLTGRQIVEVRPQVSGCITRILTAEGQAVRNDIAIKSSPLDARTFEDGNLDGVCSGASDGVNRRIDGVNVVLANNSPIQTGISEGGICHIINEGVQVHVGAVVEPCPSIKAIVKGDFQYSVFADRIFHCRNDRIRGSVHFHVDIQRIGADTT